MQQMMRQAQKMQEELQKMTTELDEKVYEGTAGGGAVSCTMTGKHVLQSIRISPDAVDPEDVEMLEDMVLAAVNDAVQKSTEDRETSMNKLNPMLGGLL